MFRVLTCLAFEHNWWLVILAGVVCLLASVTAINLFHRAQGTKGRARTAWIITAAAATGCGIWATHFIAMLAYDPGVALGYDIPLTVLSLAAAIIITGFGFRIAVYGGGWPAAATGGAIIGAGVASMHYTGMFAVQLPGHISWHLDLAMISVLLGMILGAVALLVARRSTGNKVTATAAVLLVLAIVSHHFTAMGAVQVVPDPARIIAQFTMSPSALAMAVASAAFAILALSFAGAFADRRLEERDLQLINAINNMPQGLAMFDASERLIVCNSRYLEMYGLSDETVMPGCSLRDVLASRIKAGSLNQDPEQYRATLLDGIQHGKPTSWVVETGEGRAVSVTVSAMQGGSWIATHEDITERRKAEERIAQMATEAVEKTAALTKEVEERRRIFENSVDLILVVDRQGNFIQVSPSAQAILGHRPDDMVGHNAIEFVYPDDLEATREEMRQARRGRHTRNFDTRYFHKDGRVITLSWTGVWSEPAQRHFFIGRDVTETRKAQEALKQEVEERKRVAEVLRNTIASMMDPVLVADAEGKLLIVNPPAQKIFGFLEGVDSDEYARPYDRFYPDGVTPFPFEQTALFRAVRGEAIDDLEYIIWPKGAANGFHLVAGGRPICNEAGELQGAVTIYRDVTDTKKAQAALRESEQTAHAIIDTALDAFLQFDGTGTIIDWSPKAEQLLGWPAQEAIGQKVRDLIVGGGGGAGGPAHVAIGNIVRLFFVPPPPPANRATHEERLAQFVRDSEGGALGARYEALSLRRDGRETNTEVSLTALRRRDGWVINAFIRDITEKKAAEEQLLQAQKMESVGQLTGGVAHDFNNMLTVITGTIDILGEAVADKPELAAIAKLISEAADRGAELTGQLLAFARKQPLQPRETDIYELLVETTKLLRSTLGENIEIATKLQNDIWPALIDPGQLSNALLNLAVNARDAMPGGGKLTIESDNVTIDKSVAKVIGDIDPGHYVMIAVSDTGSGIPKAILEKVFEPFFTTKEVGKGTGLGLSMVYGFVKQSGGQIKIYSEEGHGTTFRIYLPQAGEASQELLAEDVPESIAGGNETILIVEDNAPVRTSVTAQLQSLGYKTLSAANAAEALAIADGGAAFDLLFTDVIMPGTMNGRQLAEAMMQRRSPLKVLFTSGYTEDAIIHHGRLEAGVLLLQKPYRKSDLARMIRQALTSPGMMPGAQPAGRAALAS